MSFELMQFFFDIALVKIEGTLCSPIYLNYSVFDAFIDLSFIIDKSKDFVASYPIKLS